jgi:hypothetical protein
VGLCLRYGSYSGLLLDLGFRKYYTTSLVDQSRGGESKVLLQLNILDTNQWVRYIAGSWIQTHTISPAIARIWQGNDEISRNWAWLGTPKEGIYHRPVMNGMQCRKP